MKKLALLAALGLTSFGLAPTASAQSQLGVGGGYDVDREAPFIGAHARVGTPSLPIRFAPGVDFYFVDDIGGQSVTSMQFNVNALYDIGRQYTTTFTPYVGAGLGIAYSKVEDLDSDTNTGLNLVFGAEFGQNSRLRPYVQSQLTFADGTAVNLGGGVLFGF